MNECRKPYGNMKIDFLIAKSRITNRRNIAHIELNYGDRARLQSCASVSQNTQTFCQSDTLIHGKDLKME